MCRLYKGKSNIKPEQLVYELMNHPHSHPSYLSFWYHSNLLLSVYSEICIKIGSVIVS